MEKTYNFKLTEKEVNLILSALNKADYDYYNKYGDVVNQYTEVWCSFYRQRQRKSDLRK